MSSFEYFDFTTSGGRPPPPSLPVLPLDGSPSPFPSLHESFPFSPFFALPTSPSFPLAPFPLFPFPFSPDEIIAGNVGTFDRGLCIATLWHFWWRSAEFTNGLFERARLAPSRSSPASIASSSASLCNASFSQFSHCLPKNWQSPQTRGIVGLKSHTGRAN